MHCGPHTERTSRTAKNVKQSARRADALFSGNPTQPQPHMPLALPTVVLPTSTMSPEQREAILRWVSRSLICAFLGWRYLTLAGSKHCSGPPLCQQGGTSACCSGTHEAKPYGEFVNFVSQSRWLLTTQF